MILGVDVGGTFTDAVLLTGDAVVTGKAPTVAADQSEGVMAAIDQALALAGAEPAQVGRLVHGMTVATNALLEGRTAKTALVATDGFTDLEDLRRQDRRELYRLCASHPEPIVAPALRVGAPERVGPRTTLTALDEGELTRRLRDLPEDVEAVAICLLWGFRDPAHEQAARGCVQQALPDAHVSTSHETAGVFREYERLATTVVDAALSPLLRRYLRRLTERTRCADLPTPEVMLSSGGVADAATAAAHGAWTVLSGPAGGAVAAARVAGEQRAVGLDMGGTSCDVSLIDEGRVAVTTARTVGGRPLALPMVDVHTVGAGGGSIAWRDDGGALRVGPHSAGADPGPACYGRGGQAPTVTDAKLVLGHLSPDSPLAGDVRLDLEAARRAVTSLGRELELSPEDTAGGIVRVAETGMAQAVRVVTVEKGIDTRGLTLVAFGGAGPLHAARIAEELGMRRVIAPAAAGVLSALGLALSERRRDLRESVLLDGERLTASAIAEVVRRLADRGREELGEADATVRATYELRYRGQAFELPIEGSPAPDPRSLRADFDAAHERRYGYRDTGADMELVTIRVAVAMAPADLPRACSSEAREPGERAARFAGETVTTAVYGTGAAAVQGPAIVELDGATLVVPPGWSGTVDGDGAAISR